MSSSVEAVRILAVGAMMSARWHGEGAAMASVVIKSAGYLGDVASFISVGRRLVERGHRVTWTMFCSTGLMPSFVTRTPSLTTCAPH